MPEFSCMNLKRAQCPHSGASNPRNLAASAGFSLDNSARMVCPP